MKRNVDYQNLTKSQKELLHAANEAMNNAYNPYSDFYVGTALLVKEVGNTEVITGTNVENVSFGVTCCAERTAIGTAVTKGYRKFSMIAVIAKPKNGLKEDIISPCGMCRQAISEFAKLSGINIKVIMSNTNMSKIKIWNISDLLPLDFNSNDLKK